MPQRPDAPPPRMAPPLSPCVVSSSRIAAVTCGTLLLLAALAPPAHAQTGPPASVAGVGRLSGEVFDSLFTRAPLADATVYVEGLDRVITTDARGRFSVDSVPAATYRVTFFHPSLDVAGIQAPTVQGVVRAGDATELKLGTPSVATIGRRVCGASAAESSDRIVFGAVTRAGDGAIVPNALVRATWVEVAVGGRTAKPTRGGVETRATESGGFVLCGVPGDVESRVLVDAGDGSIGVTTFWPGEPGASMLAVRVPAVGSTGRARSVVLNGQGAPIANATIGAGADSSTRSDPDGGFSMKWSGHPTTDLVIRALGMQPMTLPGDEFAAPPTAVAVTMDEAGRRLAGVDVRATGRRARWLDEFDARKKAGLGSFVTRAEIDRRNPSQSYQMLFGVPGVQVDSRTGRARSLYPGSLGACEMTYWVDGVRYAEGAGATPLTLIPPTEIEAMEVYPRASGVPAEFGGSQSACGVILIWTRRSGR